jgi:hypothetical protein
MTMKAADMKLDLAVIRFAGEGTTVSRYISGRFCAWPVSLTDGPAQVDNSSGRR